jgi:NitT/TauT family transport system substrate-binding protein
MIRPKFAVLAVVAVALLSACASPAGDGGDQTPGGTEVIRYVQPSSSFAFLPIYVATVQGYFEDENLDVQRGPDSADAVQLLTAGQVDIVSGSPGEFISAIAAKRDISAIAVLTPQPPLELVLGKPVAERLAAEGITPESSFDDRIEALRGLTLTTFPEGTAANQLLRQFLSGAGMNPDTDVSIVAQTDVTAIVTSLREGQADAFLFSPPVTSSAIADGFGVHWLYFSEATDIKATYNVLTGTTGTFAKEHPEAVVGFLRALNRAFDDIKNSPDEVSKAVKAAYFADLDQGAWDLGFDFVRDIYDQGMMPSEAAFGASVDLTQETAENDVSSVNLDNAFDLTFLELATN